MPPLAKRSSSLGYTFGDGTIIRNNGTKLKVQAGRTGVVLARKGWVYQNKQSTKSFYALCFKGQAENCSSKKAYEVDNYEINNKTFIHIHIQLQHQGGLYGDLMGRAQPLVVQML